MMTQYFTFGQNHAHRVNGKTLDCDSVVKITADDPRAVMVEHFGNQWAFQYDEPPTPEYYPRGVIEL